MKKKQNRRGATLVEVMLYLGIASFIIGSAIVLFSIGENKEYGNELTIEIIQIINTATSLTNSAPDFQNITMKDIVTSGMLSHKYIHDNVIVTPYGTPITVFVYGPGNKDATGELAIYLDNLPKSPCIQLATQGPGELTQAFNVNWYWGGGVLEGGKTPDAKVAAEACKGGGTNWIGMNIHK